MYCLGQKIDDGLLGGGFEMKTLDVLAAILLVVGGLNWGLVGLFGFDLVAAGFGEASGFSRLIYMLVGAGALYQGLQWKSIQGRWSRVRAAA